MPFCLEKKLTVSGETKTYHCELLQYNAGFGILRYVIDQAYDIHGVKLAPGDETIALYWEDRPYTLYIWYRKGSPQPAYYFNIADRISLTPQEFVWRDLIVDILVDRRDVHVLDENELPPDLDRCLARSICEATAHILDNFKAIIQEAEIAIQKLPPVPQ